MSYISAAQAKQIAQKAVDNLKDGTLVPKLADNLTPYAEDSGTTQTQPFFLEGTATGNGESRVDAKQVPAFAFLQEKCGNMICVNQLVDTNTTSVTLTSGHVYFLTLNGESEIVTGAGEGVLVTGGIDIVSDLTRWFNGNIPAYLLSHPEAFGRYYKGSLAYEPGRLEPATGRYLTSVGRNLYDGEHDVEVSPSTRYYCTGLATITYKGVNGESIGNETVANDSFNTPSNCYSIGISAQTPSITISLYYSGESGYDKYYPHEVLATIDTGTESLYSAGSAYDSKVPSGLITHNIYSVDLATLNYSYSTGGNGFWYSTELSNLIKSVAISALANMLSAKYSVVAANTITGGTAAINSMGLNGTNLYIYNGSSTESPTGTLYFELATPTTEQGTPFQENVPIDDFGQLSWSNTNVPQGNQIFYPVDYKAYEDTLIKYTDGDATSLALKSYVNSLVGAINTVLDSVNGVVI